MGRDRRPPGAHRVVGAITARRIGQDREFFRIQIVEQILFIGIGDVDPAHGDRYDLGAELGRAEPAIRDIAVWDSAGHAIARLEAILPEAPVAAPAAKPTPREDDLGLPEPPVLDRVDPVVRRSPVLARTRLPKGGRAAFWG